MGSLFFQGTPVTDIQYITSAGGDGSERVYMVSCNGVNRAIDVHVEFSGLVAGDLVRMGDQG